MTDELPIFEMFKSLDRDGVPGLYPYMHEDVVFRFGSFPAGCGRDAFNQAWCSMAIEIEALRHEILDVWDRGDSVLCRGDVTYSLKEGRDVTVPFADIFYLRDGKIAEYLIFVDASAVFGPSAP